MPYLSRYVGADPPTNTNSIRINILALSARLPTLQGVRENVEPGNLVLWTKLHGVAAVVGAPVLGGRRQNASASF
jgi:hypothetical protein